ncbi:MAG: DUF4340 domain-containing protein [Phycisphaerales bacterium]|nr:DUF4340 domain-containing protein [Phycisphaerales bacterium]
MSSRQLIIVGIVAAAAIAGAIVAVNSANQRTTPFTPGVPGPAGSAGARQGEPFLQGLAARTADVVTVRFQRQDAKFSARLADGRWVIPEKGNFPALDTSVRAVVVGMATLSEAEPLTSRPERYDELGVGDPTGPQANPRSGTLITLLDKADQPIAALIVGNLRPAGASAGGEGVYVRRPGESQSFAVRGSLNPPKEPVALADASFVNIGRDRLRTYTITHPPADAAATPPTSIEFRRAAATDTGFTLQNIPAGRTISTPGAGEGLATLLSVTSFQDVAPVASIFDGSPEAKPGPSAVYQAFDGLIVRLDTVARAGKQWWRLRAEVEPEIVGPLQNPPAETKPRAEVEKEAADLNARWSPWAYAPFDFKTRSLDATFDSLLAPLPQAPTGGTGPTGPSDAPAPGELTIDPISPPPSPPE